MILNSLVLLTLLQGQILSQFLMASALSCTSCPRFALIRLLVLMIFKAAVTFVFSGKAVADNQGVLSRACVQRLCFLLLAKLLRGTASKRARVASTAAAQCRDIAVMLYF